MKVLEINSGDRNFIVKLGICTSCNYPKYLMEMTVYSNRLRKEAYMSEEYKRIHEEWVLVVRSLETLCLWEEDFVICGKCLIELGRRIELFERIS